MNETFTVKQVAKILGYSTNSIYTFLKEGRIKGVRVGKGRFRVSLEELKRLLHISKNQDAFTQYGDVKTLTPTTPATSLNQGNFSVDMADAVDLDKSTLFDWFVGVASILLGASMFLYNQYSTTAKFIPFSSWAWVFRVCLIAAGLGVFLSNIVKGKVSELWHKIFHGVLIITYLFYVFMRVQVGDGGGATLFGVFTAIMILSIFMGLGEIESFLLFVSAVAIATPLALVLHVPIFDSPPPFSFSINQFYPWVYIWLVVTILIEILTWISKSRNARLFLVLMSVHGIAIIGVGIWFADALSWGKALFLLTAGLASLILPFWPHFSSSDNFIRRKITFFLVGILTILLLVVGVLYLMELNIREYAAKELKSKAIYGKLLTNSVLGRVRETTRDLAANPLLIDAIEKEKQDSLIKILKLAFTGNDYIRRFLILKSDGSLLSIYPFATLTATNFSSRDYFIKTKETRKEYLSDSFQSTLIDRKWIIVVTAPIFDKDNNLLGILVGSIDLEKLGGQLQEIATPSNQEQFEGFDKQGTVIIHSDYSFIGKKGREEIEAFNNEGYNDEGIKVFQYGDKLDDGWFLAIQAPMDKILAPTKTVFFVLFLTIMICVVASGFYFTLYKDRKP